MSLNPYNGARKVNRTSQIGIYDRFIFSDSRTLNKKEEEKRRECEEKFSADSPLKELELQLQSENRTWFEIEYEVLGLNECCRKLREICQSIKFAIDNQMKKDNTQNGFAASSEFQLVNRSHEIRPGQRFIMMLEYKSAESHYISPELRKLQQQYKDKSEEIRKINEQINELRDIRKPITKKRSHILQQIEDRKNQLKNE